MDKCEKAENNEHCYHSISSSNGDGEIEIRQVCCWCNKDKTLAFEKVQYIETPHRPYNPIISTTIYKYPQ